MKLLSPFSFLFFLINNEHLFKNVINYNYEYISNNQQQEKRRHQQQQRRWYDISAFTWRTASIRRMAKREFPSARPVSGPRLGWTAAPPPQHTDTFLLPGQVISAYLLRLLLNRAGDIETNPGPACHACNKTLRPSQAFLTCCNPTATPPPTSKNAAVVLNVPR